MRREYPCDNAADGCPNSAGRNGLCDDCHAANDVAKPRRRVRRRITHDHELNTADG